MVEERGCGRRAGFLAIGSEAVSALGRNDCAPRAISARRLHRRLDGSRETPACAGGSSAVRAMMLMCDGGRGLALALRALGADGGRLFVGCPLPTAAVSAPALSH